MRRSQRPVGIAALALAALVLSGCGLLVNGPPPTSTYEGADGKAVVVSWEDYPGEAGLDSSENLAAPDRDALEPVARELMAELREVIEDAAGVALEPLTAEATWFADENWYVAEGNGYGGESMLTTLNCCDLQAAEVPPADQWQEVLDAASEVTERHGLGPLVPEYRSEPMRAEPSWLAEHEKQYCNGVRDECWAWFATAYGDGQWVSFAMIDRARDKSGAAAKDAEQFDAPLATTGVSYGATVIDSGRRAEFEAALEPFVGLDQPEPTTSD
jgi:hypothetical protein